MWTFLVIYLLIGIVLGSIYLYYLPATQGATWIGYIKALAIYTPLWPYMLLMGG